jgi:hypothetical protein
MPYPILQLLDANDAVEYDFHDDVGTNNPQSVKTHVVDDDFNIGGDGGKDDYFESDDIPGGYRIHSREGLETMSFLLGMESDSYQKLTASLSTLSGRVRDLDGKSLRWQADSTADDLRFDIESVRVGALFDGRPNAGQELLQGKVVYRGVRITIVRQPYARLGEITSDTNVLTNATLLEDADGNGRPDDWTWAGFLALSAESIEALTETYKFSVVDSTVSDTLTSATATAAPGDVWTASVDAKATGVGRVGVRVQFLDASDVVLQTTSLAVAALADFTRIAQTSVAAPAGTAKVRMQIAATNSATPGTGTYWVRRAQLEKASTASKFTTGNKVVRMDPKGQTMAPSSAPTATNVQTAGNVNGGTHSYKVTFVTSSGETSPSAKSNVVTADADLGTGGNQNAQVDITAIPTGPSGVTARKIYRTVAGDTGDWKLVATINDNTTTTYRDNTADASLGAAAPTSNTTTKRVGRMVPIWIEGDAPAPVKFELVGDTGARIQSVVMAARSGDGIPPYLNGFTLQAEDTNLTPPGSVNAPPATLTVVSDPDASTGSAVQGTLTTAWARFLRFTITDQTLLEALRDAFDVRLRFKLSGKQDAELQMRWGDTLTTPAPVTTVPVLHNTNIGGLTTFGYIEKSLGAVALSEKGTLDGLAIEVWARKRDNLAAQTITFDHTALAPTEQRTTLSTPYGSKLMESGTSVNHGSGLGVALWRETWRYSVQNPTSDYVLRFQIKKGGVVTFSRDIAHTSDVTNATTSIEFDSVSGSAYVAEVVVVTGTGTLTVHDVFNERVALVEANGKLLSDPSVGVDTVKQISATGRIEGDAAVGGPVPFWLPPRMSYVYVEVQEPRYGGLYAEQASNNRRAPTLKHSYAPRVRP